MIERAKYPLRVFDRAGTVAIFDALDREVVHWTGFDGSRIGLRGARDLAHKLVAAANAAWNRCAEPAAHDGDVEALVEELEAEVAMWEHGTGDGDRISAIRNRLLAALRTRTPQDNVEGR